MVGHASALHPYNDSKGLLPVALFSSSRWLTEDPSRSCRDCLIGKQGPYFSRWARTRLESGYFSWVCIAETVFFVVFFGVFGDLVPPQVVGVGRTQSLATGFLKRKSRLRYPSRFCFRAFPAPETMCAEKIRKKSRCPVKGRKLASGKEVEALRRSRSVRSFPSRRSQLRSPFRFADCSDSAIH